MNKVEILHQAACKRKQNGYSDPETGFFVLTEYYLAQRGHCCGAGCRHCPYDATEQRRAGREIITGAEILTGTESNSYSDTNKADKKEQATTQKSDHTETR
jgi:hypothetical protein